VRGAHSWCSGQQHLTMTRSCRPTSSTQQVRHTRAHSHTLGDSAFDCVHTCRQFINRWLALTSHPNSVRFALLVRVKTALHC